MENDTILNDISDKLLEVLSQSGMDIDGIDFQELVNREVGVLDRPKVSISINSGAFQKVTMNSVNKLTPIISLFIVVFDLNEDGEKERRFAINKLIIGIANLVLNQKFGLPLIAPFTPVNFVNVTDITYAKAGYALYQLDLRCSFQIDKSEDLEDNQGELLKIVNNYFLNTPLDDGEVDMIGQVDFLSLFGGNAFSEYSLEPIFGGYAGTKYINDPIYGGKANSTYNN